MDCVKIVGMVFDALREDCINCEFFNKCKEERNGGKTKEKKVSKVEMKTEEIEHIAKNIRDSFTASAEEITNYRGCVKVIKRIEEEYKNQGIRRKKNYKDRIHEIKPDIKELARFSPPVDNDELLEKKLNSLVDYAEYIILG